MGGGGGGNSGNGEEEVGVSVATPPSAAPVVMDLPSELASAEQSDSHGAR